MRRLRVLVVTNLYPTPETPWFGCFVQEQVEDLRELGIEIGVLHFDGRRETANYARAAVTMHRLLRRQPFDLVHAHYGLSGAIAITQVRLPVVTTFHGSDYTNAIPWQRWVSWVVSRRCLPVLASAAGRTSLGLPHAPVIPVGVDTRLFRPRVREEALEELGWDPARRYVLLPGSRSVAGKGAALFDVAFREARRGVPELRPVSLEGLSRDRVAQVLAAVDVLLMTSLREGSPATVREALACTTPVVSVAVGDVAQTIEGLPGCAIARRDPGELAAAVLRALETGKRLELRERALAFTRPRTAERVAAVYDSATRRT